MAVLEDFESVADWTPIAANGTVTIQGAVAVVGNAVEYASDGGEIGRYKTFAGLTSYGIYIRSKNEGGNNRVICDLVDYGVVGILTIYLGYDDNNFHYKVKAGRTDTGIGVTADTWYWFGVEKVDATHANIYCYNEAKTVELWKVENVEIETWVANPELTTQCTGGETCYFDELTDDGSPPAPAAGATMNMKGYW